MTHMSRLIDVDNPSNTWEMYNVTMNDLISAVGPVFGSDDDNDNDYNDKNLLFRWHLENHTHKIYNAHQNIFASRNHIMGTFMRFHVNIV